MYAVLTMDESLDMGDLENEFVLISSCREISHEVCGRACQELRSEPDIGCYVSLAGSSYPYPWDVGESLPIDTLLCRSSAVKCLMKAGFQPLVGLSELSSALRHAGWRVRMSAVPLTEGPTRVDCLRAGRRQFAEELYDRASEQLLAQGPRLLKRTIPYFGWLAGKRLSEGSPFLREAGYFSQAAWSALRGHRARLASAPWRDISLPFRFPEPHPDSDTAVLLFTALRPWYLRRALRALHQHWPTDRPPRLVVSQDGGEKTTRSMIDGLNPQVLHYQFQGRVSLPFRAWRKGLAPYYRIAQHFGASIDRVFRELPVHRVVILEDDIEIGGDFFPYLDRFAPLLESDPDLLAVSAWNDHAVYASDPDTVHRTDCFPGQGWMINRPTWQSLKGEWPDTLWDEWLRRPDVRRGRHFLRPELNRVRNFGRAGTGSSEFFDAFISPLRWQEEAHDWKGELSDLSIEGYRDRLWNQIAGARRIEHPDELDEEDGVIVYEGKEDFTRIAELLGIVGTYHSSGPRAAFEGVVTLRVRGVQLFLLRRETLTRVSSGV